LPPMQVIRLNSGAIESCPSCNRLTYLPPSVAPGAA